MRRCISPGTVGGTITVPGSRSVTNRALVTATLAEGTSRIRNAAQCDDAELMVGALRALGVNIERGHDDLIVDSRDGFGLRDAAVWAGASGTTARFLTALGTLCGSKIAIDGEPRLRERPLRELIEALRALGAHIEGDGLPVVIGRDRPHGGAVTIDASASSQFVSALAMIGPTLDGGLTIWWERLASRPFVDATVAVMSAFGVEAGLGASSLTVSPDDRYRPTSVGVPPDAASAVYPALAAALTGGRILIEGLHARPAQPDLRVFDVLEEMGCRVEWKEAGVTIEGPRAPSAVDADMREAPDGALVVAVAAGFAHGTSTIRGLETLSSKESDRLRGLADGLRSMGAHVSSSDEALRITGRVHRGATIDPHDDHRMAMVFSVAGLSQEGVCVGSTSCVTKTWPGFYRDMEEIAGPGWASFEGGGR
jgi:3-phosphoshikimate 1-carboxyvinyltransferase